MPKQLTTEVKEKLDILLDAILENDLSIFFGAGISFYPPTNLPVGSSLRRAIFDHLFNVPLASDLGNRILSNAEYGVARDKLLSGYSNQVEHGVEYSAKYYPFELFVETIHEQTGLVFSLARLFKLGEPNFIHEFLASLVLTGKIWRLMTTNFDEHVETAIKNNSKMRYDEVIKVLMNESDFAFLSNYTFCKLYKIHGTCSNIGSMRTTMKAIANSILTPHREKVIKQMFEEEKIILVLGYSGSDEFDVNQALKKCNKDSTVFWIRRPKQGLPAVDDLVYPFDGFNGNIIRVDLIDLVAFLAGELDFDYKPVGYFNNEWIGIIQSWSEGLSLGQKVHTITRLLPEVQLIDDSIQLLDCALDNRHLFSEEEISAFLLTQTNLTRDKGDIEKSDALGKENLGYSQKSDNKKSQALVFYTLGINAYNVGNYVEAEQYYKKALELSRALNDWHLLSYTLHQLGNLYYFSGRVEQAETNFLESLEIQKQIGDEKEVAGNYHMLSRIHQDIGNLDEAEQLLRMSLELSERLGNEQGISTSLLNLGMVILSKGSVDEAEEIFRRCLELNRKHGNVLGESLTIQNIASIFEQKGDLDEAERLYRQSLAIKKKIGNQRGIGYSYQGLGSIEMKRGNYDVAEMYFRTTLSIRRKLNDRKGIMIITKILEELEKRRSG